MKPNRIVNWLLPSILLFSFLALLFGCAPLTAIKKGYDFTKINRIGVLEFTSYREEIYAGNAVTDEFIRQLIFRDIDVIERERLESLLREQQLAGSKYLDPETVKQVGKLLGVDALITGTVTKYIIEDKDTIYFKDEDGNIKTQVFLKGAEVGVSARMIDVETGLIVWAGSYTYESFDMEGAIRGTVSTLLNSLKKVWPQVKKS
jgi:TolB-like protein